jgi:hypothetical protein
MSASRHVAPLLVSIMVSVAGDGAFLTAAPLLAAALTSDPVTVSVVTAVGFLPWLAVGLPAGAVVDRSHRQTAMIVADLCRALLVAALAVAILAERVSIAMLVVTVALVGVAQTFFDAAAQAFVPSVVGRDRGDLAQVNGRLWVADTAGRSLVGPPLGSLTFAVAQALPFALDALSFLVSAGFVRQLPQVPAMRGPHAPIGAAIRSGFRYLVASAELRGLVLGMTAYNLGHHMAMATLVLYVTHTLDLSTALYGVMLGVAALGGIAVGLLARSILRRLAYGTAMASTMVVQAVAWIGVSVVDSPWAVGGFLAVVGGCGSLASIAVAAARQELTPDDLIGRVVTAFRFMGFGAAGVGALAAGFIAAGYGLGAPPVAAAIVLLTGAVIAVRGSRPRR